MQFLETLPPHVWRLVVLLGGTSLHRTDVTDRIRPAPRDSARGGGWWLTEIRRRARPAAPLLLDPPPVVDHLLRHLDDPPQGTAGTGLSMARGPLRPTTLPGAALDFTQASAR